MNRNQPFDRNAQAAQMVKECRTRIQQAKELIRLSKKLTASIDTRLAQSEDISRRTEQLLIDTNRLFESRRFARPFRSALR
jgi:hypothetical protein